MVLRWRARRSPAERLLYVLQAVALGFACAAARACTGTLWMAVGVYTGHLLLPTRPLHHGVQFVIPACALTVTGLLLLRPRRRGASVGRGVAPV
ncbi:hypothetical protein ABZ815_13635 [Nonomuraea sp. NPDC047529]|uniref:hypothetical protein n=1 Tax=Nonomuraea sp. NPDC047529 TaxID=3155623 RepID=UPI0033E08680